MNPPQLKKYLPHLVDSPYWEQITLYVKDNQDEFILSQKRDNCGIAAAGFVLFMKKEGLEIQRVRGDFITDTPLYTKLDFYKEDLQEMRYLGLNPNVKEDRVKFVEDYDLKERQKAIPHYWNSDSAGNIIDLSGHSQFVKSKLAENLSASRYHIVDFTQPDLGYVSQSHKKPKI